MAINSDMIIQMLSFQSFHTGSFQCRANSYISSCRLSPLPRPTNSIKKYRKFANNSPSNLSWPMSRIRLCVLLMMQSLWSSFMAEITTTLPVSQSSSSALLCQLCMQTLFLGSKQLETPKLSRIYSHTYFSNLVYIISRTSLYCLSSFIRFLRFRPVIFYSQDFAELLKRFIIVPTTPFLLELLSDFKCNSSS